MFSLCRALLRASVAVTVTQMAGRMALEIVAPIPSTLTLSKTEK